MLEKGGRGSDLEKGVMTPLTNYGFYEGLKININFYFHTSLWCLKRFYEGFTVPIFWILSLLF